MTHRSPILMRVLGAWLLLCLVAVRLPFSAGDLTLDGRPGTLPEFSQPGVPGEGPLGFGEFQRLDRRPEATDTRPTGTADLAPTLPRDGFEPGASPNRRTVRAAAFPSPACAQVPLRV